MNVLGTWKTVTFTGTTSAEVDLGRDFARVLVLIPTIADSTTTIHVAIASGGTFFPMYKHKPEDDGDTEQMTTARTNTKAIMFDCGAQFIKIVCGSTQTAETFYVRGLD